MAKKFYITSEQLNEIINSDLLLSTTTTPDYCGSEVSVTEPVGDDNYGKPTTTDDKARNMPPSFFQRLTSRGMYGGPIA